MSTLFYKEFSGITNWQTYGPIDRHSAPTWGATITMDAASTGTMEFLLEVCSDNTCTTREADLMAESYPFGGAGQSIRIQPPGMNDWQRTYDPALWPYFQVNFRTTFAAGVWNGSVEVDDGTPSGPCHYGTQKSDFALTNVLATDTVVTIWLTARGMAWAAAIFDAISAYLLSSDTLCASNPPEMPTSVANILAHPTSWPTVMPSVQDLITAAEAMAWPQYCVCTPAPPDNPDPIPYPLPAPIVPDGGAPTVVELLCDNGDLCSALNAIMRQLQGINFNVTLLRRDVTLIQRQAVPFGYVHGTTHSGLTGAGVFTVSDILGLSVTCTTVPPRFISKGADPATYYRLGWVNTGTVDGWQRATELRHNPELILPLQGEVTTVGYDLDLDVVADIVELVREP